MSCKLFSSLIALVFMLLLSGCTTPRIEYLKRDVALDCFNKRMLLINPVSVKKSNAKYASGIGKGFKVVLNKKFGGQVVYSGDIKELSGKMTYDAVMRDGVFNIEELSALGGQLKVDSVMVCELVDYKPYPPFRAVLSLAWFDVKSKNFIARLYHSVDLEEIETRQRFGSFVGDGAARELYELVFYSKAKYETAMLQPEVFNSFAAAYCSEIMFDDILERRSWRMWSIF